MSLKRKRKPLSGKRIIEAIAHCRGNMAGVARHLGYNRSYLYRWISNQSEEMQGKIADALQDQRESMLDEAEGVLHNKVLDGDTASLIFFLKTQGYKRGYTERTKHEVTGEGGGPVNIVIDWGDKKDYDAS